MLIYSDTYIYKYIIGQNLLLLILARKIYAEEQQLQVVVGDVAVAPYVLADVVVDAAAAAAAVEKHVVGVHHVEADGALNGFELHMLRVVAAVANEMLLPLNVVVVAAGDEVVVAAAAEVDAAIVVGDRTYIVVALAFAAVVVVAAAVVALVGAFVAAA